MRTEHQHSEFSSQPVMSLESLTPLLPACFEAKASSFHVSLCRNISRAESIRELFKPLKDSEKLQVCHKKFFLVFGFEFF